MKKSIKNLENKAVKSIKTIKGGHMGAGIKIDNTSVGV